MSLNQYSLFWLVIECLFLFIEPIMGDGAYAAPLLRLFLAPLFYSSTTGCYMLPLIKLSSSKIRLVWKLIECSPVRSIMLESIIKPSILSSSIAIR